MKNIKTKIILSAIILLSVVSFVGTVNAAGPSLYVLPATLTKAPGNIFSVSVGLNASGSKVCAVEGTLVFNKLSCQSIIVASDVMAQSSPTCSNPHFLIGIPNCTTLDKTLLTVSVKAGSAGTASISSTGVDIIGEGASVGSTFVSGNYTIADPVVVPPKETPVVKNQPKITQKTPEEVVPEEEVVVQQQEEVAPAPVVTTTDETNVAQAGLLGPFMNIMSLGTGKTWLANLLIIIILIAIVFGVFYFIKKPREKK